MVFFIHSSYIYNFTDEKINKNNCEKLFSELNLKETNSNVKYFIIIFSITTIKELENNNLKENIKEQFKQLKKDFDTFFKSIYNYELFLSLKVNILVSEFKDKHISTLISLKQTVDFSIIYSYSNTMLTQCTSKSCAHMIANVCSQELVKRFDFIHHYNSGINHVLCNEMSEKNMILGVDVDLFYNSSSPITQSRYFSSCIQNSKLATKSNIAHILFTVIEKQEDIRSTRELVLIQKALFKAQPKQIIYQQNYLNEYFSKLIKIKNLDYIE